MSRSACTCDVFLQFHLNITLCREHMSYIKCYIFVLNFTWTLHCTCIFQLLLNDYLCHPVFVTLQHSSLGGKVRSFSSWIYLFLFLTFSNSFSSCPCVNLYTRAFIYWYFFSFLFVAAVRTSLTQASKAADLICTETKIFEFFLSFWLSSTPVVLLNYHFTILSRDNVRIKQSKTSDD